MMEATVLGAASIADGATLVLVIALWLRAGVVFIRANGTRPLIAFFLATAIVLGVGAGWGLFHEEGPFYPVMRSTLIVCGIVTHEWAQAHDWRPWRWRW